MISIAPITPHIRYENGKIVFSEKIKPNLSFPFRTGIGFDYIKTFAVGLILVSLPKVYMISAGRSDLVYPIDFANDVIILILFLAVVSFVKSVLKEINSLFGVYGAKRGESRIRIEDIFYRKDTFYTFREKLLSFLYEKTKLDRILLISVALIYTTFTITDMKIRYELSGGDLYYTFFGLWTLQAVPPVYMIFAPFVIGFLWALATYIAFLYLLKIPYVIFMLGRLEKFSDDLNIVHVIKGYIRRLNESINPHRDEGKYEISNINAAYTTVWRVGNTISKLSVQIGIFVLFVVLIYYGVLILGIIFPKGPINWQAMMGLFSIGYITIIIAISVFIAPLLGFHELFIHTKSIINSYLQDLYEKLIFRYFTLSEEERRKSDLSISIRIIQDALIYTQELSVWPFSVPQLIRLGFFSGLSAAVPQLVKIFFT